jgi:hypothetical protein
MNTFFARNRLSAFLDCELSDDDARAVVAALEQDEELRKELAQLREAIRLLRGDPVSAPPGFAARVAALTASEPPPARRRVEGWGSFFLRAAGGAAAGALVVGVAHLALRAYAPSAPVAPAVPMEAVGATAASAGGTDASEPSSGPELGSDPGAAGALPGSTPGVSVGRALLDQAQSRASLSSPPTGSGMAPGMTGAGKGDRAGSGGGVSSVGMPAGAPTPAPSTIPGTPTRPAAPRLSDGGVSAVERAAFAAEHERYQDLGPGVVVIDTKRYRVVLDSADGISSLRSTAQGAGWRTMDRYPDAGLAPGASHTMKFLVPAGKYLRTRQALSGLGRIAAEQTVATGPHDMQTDADLYVEWVAPDEPAPLPPADEPGPGNEDQPQGVTPK